MPNDISSMKRVAIVTSYPPPYGGVSVFAERLSQYLKSINFDHTCYAPSSNQQRTKRMHKDNVVYVKNSRWWLMKYLFFSKEQLIHLNKTTATHFLVFGLLKQYRKKKLIINRHNEHLYSYYMPSKSARLKDRLRIACFNYGYHNADHIIIVNERIRPSLNQLGIPDEKISCIPAFIPPCESIEAILSKEVDTFIKKYKYIISSNGSVILFKGCDLYGFDLLIDLMERLNDKDTGLLIYLRLEKNMNSEEKKHYEFLKGRLKDNVWGKRVLLYEAYDEEYWPILAKSHIFIRPTITDGDSVSVRESLFFGLKTICSDVTPRPKGAILFKSRDIEDLTKKATDAFNDLKNNTPKRKTDAELSFTNAARILETYNRILK